MNKAFVLIFCGLSLFLWEVRDVRSQVLPSDQEILKRQALSRLQDREWLSTLRMTLWPSAYPEEPIYYGETNVTHQSGRTWYHLEAGGVWQQLPRDQLYCTILMTICTLRRTPPSCKQPWRSPKSCLQTAV